MLIGKIPFDAIAMESTDKVKSWILQYLGLHFSPHLEVWGTYPAYGDSVTLTFLDPHNHNEQIGTLTIQRIVDEEFQIEMVRTPPLSILGRIFPWDKLVQSVQEVVGSLSGEPQASTGEEPNELTQLIDSEERQAVDLFIKTYKQEKQRGLVKSIDDWLRLHDIHTTERNFLNWRKKFSP
jgi:hypothetical protein